MEINKVIERLNKIQEIIKSGNNEKILTDLFEINDNYIDIHNLFYQIQFEGKHVTKWITEGLLSIKEFSNYQINNRESDEIRLEIKPPRTAFESDFEYKYVRNDVLAEIDLIAHTYKLTGYSEIKKMEEYMNKPIEKLNDKQLSDFWLDAFKHKDMKISDRFYYFKKCRKQNERILSCFKMALFSKKKINENVNLKLEEIKQMNDGNLQYYNEQLAKQQEYRKIYPEYIQRIKDELISIQSYLSLLGYTEVIYDTIKS